MLGRESSSRAARQVRWMILWLVCVVFLFGHVPAVAQEQEPSSVATSDQTDRVSGIIVSLDHRISLHLDDLTIFLEPLEALEIAEAMKERATAALTTDQPSLVSGGLGYYRFRNSRTRVQA